MISLAHLIDDHALGGVTRTLADQTELLQGRFQITQHAVSPRRPLPPRVTEDIAIIHHTASWSKLPFLTLLRAQRGNRPIIIVEHTYTREFERRCVPDRQRFRRMLALTYRLADAVVAVSEGQASWMLEAGLAPREKLTFINPTVDYQALLDVPALERRRGGPLRLASWGRYCEQKGFEVLIEAMKAVPADIAVLELAGYGPEGEMLSELARSLPNVKIGGRVEKTSLGRFLAGCDAVVLPSRWEAFGNVALEARAAARPIVVSEVDGLTEQVAPAHGLLVPSEDPARLAEAIRQLAGRDIASMGAAARQSVANHLSNHVARWTALLERLAGEKNLTKAA